MNYVNYLIEINKKICEKNNVRDMNSLEIISNAINAIDQNDKSTFLNSAMKISALIKLYQPFYDGNHRTAIIVFGDLLVQNGYEFDYESALSDMKNHKLNLPTLYSEEDEITNISKFEKYILSYPKTL
jgi:prophage maintenance system killer protein